MNNVHPVHPPSRRTSDVLWVVVASVSAVLLVNVVVTSLWRAVTGASWVELALAPFGVLLCWWLMLGSWHRTSWGRRAVASGPSSPT